MMTFDEYVISKWKELGYGINEATPASPSPGKPGDKTYLNSSAAAAEALKRVKPNDTAIKAELLAKLAELRRAGK